MNRLSDRNAIIEARRFKTLTLGRAVGSGGGGGVAVPQATAQNQIIIADSTPVWSLLAAPTAQGQALITGADPFTPAWGTTFPTTIRFNDSIELDANTYIKAYDSNAVLHNIIHTNDHVITINAPSVAPSEGQLDLNADGVACLRVTSCSVIVNDDGRSADFCVEASGAANALFVQGSDGLIGIAHNTPTAFVHIYPGDTQTNAAFMIEGTYNAQQVINIIPIITYVTANPIGVELSPEFDLDTNVANVYGTVNVADLGGSADVTTAVNSTLCRTRLQSTFSGTVACANVMRIEITNNSTSGGTITSARGIYITALDTTVTGDAWGIYQAGADDKNYFAGGVTIQENSATVRLSGTFAFHFVIPEPIVEAVGQLRIPWACTVTRVDANTQGGTSCTFNIEERSTLGSTGTNVLSSDMAADSNGESVTSSFNNSSLAAGNYLTFDVSAVSGAVDFVSITLTGTVD